MTDLLTEQTPPVPNEGEAIADIVIREYGHHSGLTDLFAERKRQGIERYGVPLQAGNGRDPLAESMQKAIDLAFYLRQHAEEQKLAGKDSSRAMEAYHQAVFMVRRVLKLGEPEQ